MTDINFYHLTKSPMGKALPKLLEKVVTSGARAIVIAEDDERLQQLNKELWTYTTKFFLPHGTKEDGYSEDQPLYLTVNYENPNGANILAIVDDAEVKDLEKFDRCLYMFDGNKEAKLKTARSRWTKMKTDGHNVTYWQQNAKGWEKQA